MWIEETKPECCKDEAPLPTHIKCLVPKLCQDWQHLYRLHHQAFVKNYRISELSKQKPSLRTHRFVNRCPCHFRKNIEIIRLEKRVCTRTEQLAYPRARYLLLFKQQIAKLFPPDRIIVLNRLIRKSLFSLYSRLGNVRPPKQIKPVPKWTRADWEIHTKALKRLAKHKKVKIPPLIPGRRMSLNRMKRYKSLAKPKKCDMVQKPEWALTSAMFKHKASKRTKELSRPIIRDTSMLYQDLPIVIPPAVLKHKASNRTKDLAKPNARRQGQSAPSDLKENPFAISPNALKTKASKRTKDLAEPKMYENIHIREDPYAISKAALSAKAKPRTIELARPRKRS